MTDILLEVCVDDIAGLQAAIEGGADRIELCSALDLGGMTPSAGLMTFAARTQVPCYAMIRPRAGNFVYSPDELTVMEDDIRFAASCGLAGVVFGVNLADGRLDTEAMKKLSEAVPGMPRTLHRAFDLVPDLEEALEVAIACGFERILTSGRATSVPKGLSELRKLVEIADRRIRIMPGGGVNLGTVDAILETVEVIELHSSCSTTVDITDPAVVAFGFSASTIKRTDATVVHALKQRLTR